MSLGSSVFTVSAAALLATAASGAPSPNPRYAGAAALRAAEGVVTTCYEDERDKRHGCEARVGEQIWQAFHAVVAQMFRTAAEGTDPDLRIELSRPDAQVERHLGYPLAMISEVVVISSPTAGEIDRVHARGVAEVFNDTPQSVAAAFERAANDTAARFERGFANSEPIAAWLTGKVAQSAPAGSSIIAPGRGEFIGFIDGAFGGVDTVEGYSISGRAGLAGRWFVVQGVVQTWTQSWGFYRENGLSATSFGFEAGPVVRLGRDWEVRVGGGLHWASGSLDKSNAPGGPTQPSGNFSRTMPALFGAVQYAVWPRGPTDVRFRIGAEIRKFLDDEAPVNSIQQVVPIGGVTVSATFGVEFGFVKSRIGLR